MSATRLVMHRGWPRRVLAQPRGAGALLKTAAEMGDAVRSNVPVRTGQTQAEYGAMAPVLSSAGGLPGARIPIASHIWHIIEFGSVHNPPYAPIRRGADSLGLRFNARGGAS